jgi:hypothetical protein
MIGLFTIIPAPLIPSLQIKEIKLMITITIFYGQRFDHIAPLFPNLTPNPWVNSKLLKITFGT